MPKTHGMKKNSGIPTRKEDFRPKKFPGGKRRITFIIFFKKIEECNGIQVP